MFSFGFVALQDLAVVMIGEIGHVAQVRYGMLDFSAARYQGFALLLGNAAGKHLVVFLNQVGDLLEVFAAGWCRELRPFHLRGLGRQNRAFDLFLCGARDPGKDFFSSRVGDFDEFPVTAVGYELPVNEQLILFHDLPPWNEFNVDSAMGQQRSLTTTEPPVRRHLRTEIRSHVLYTIRIQ